MEQSSNKNGIRVVSKYIKEICVFGFGYSSVIGFCLFGPLLRIISGRALFTNTIIALTAFIVAFLNPLIRKMNKRLILNLFYIAILLLASSYFIGIESVAIFCYAFVIATFCRSFTLHVLDNVAVKYSEVVMSLAFFIAFLVLFIINVSKPYLSRELSFIIVILIGGIAAFFFKLTIDDNSLKKKKSHRLNKHIFFPLLSLFLVYIGGGISYSGIYPYLAKFESIDRFYNVLPLVVTVPIAGILGKKYGNLINLLIGIVCLSVAFAFFLLPHTVSNYIFIQTFLQIGWAFTNVFGFSYSWRLAKKYELAYLFGYGIISILLGVTSGSVVSNYFIEYHLPIIYFGPVTFIPMIIGLVFQFFNKDIKLTGYVAESKITFQSNGSNLELTEGMDERRVSSVTNKEGDLYKMMSIEKERICNLDLLSELTNREKEIIYFYYKGESAVKIADRLYLSPNTIRSHIKNAYHKLEINKKAILKELIDQAVLDSN